MRKKWLLPSRYSFAGAGNVDERRYISTFTSVLGKDGHCLC